MKKKPINLNLMTIRFPLPAIASILHRISGVFLFLLIPLFLWILQQSLVSETGFMEVKALFDLLWVKFVVWVGLTALLYHLIAGIRHLVMDWGIGESLAAARTTATLTIILSIILSVILGITLW